jgi:hypothetical protein
MESKELHAIAEDVRLILKLLNGNGDPSKGLIVRVDRLEQDHQRQRWLSKSAIGACITGIIAMVVHMLKH